MTTQPMSIKVPINNKIFSTFKNIKNIVHIFYSSFVGNNNVALPCTLCEWLVTNLTLANSTLWIQLNSCASLVTWALALKMKVAINIIFPHVHGHHSHLKFMVVKCFLLFIKITIFMFNLHGVDLGGWIIWREWTYFP
jgi:hypothetical protein